MKALISNLSWVLVMLALYAVGFWHGRDFQRIQNERSEHSVHAVDRVSISQTSSGRNSGNVVVLDGGDVVISGDDNEAHVVINGKEQAKK